MKGSSYRRVKKTSRGGEEERRVKIEKRRSEGADGGAVGIEMKKTTKTEMQELRKASSYETTYENKTMT